MTGVMESLLAPLGVDEFVRDYWATQSVYVPGTPSKFARLFDHDRFRAAVAPRPGLPDDPAFQVNAIIPARPDHPLTRMATEHVSPDQIDALVDAGNTICVNKISARDWELDNLARSAARELGWTGTAWFNGYLSPGNSGADLHWDSQITTTLQISGSKRWRYAPRPSLDWPVRPAQLQPDGTVTYFGVEPDAVAVTTQKMDTTSFAEVVLEPGDVLCLPAGTWHSAKGVGHSFALNLAFGPPRMSDLVARVAQSALGLEPEWRSALPPVPGAAERGVAFPGDVLAAASARLYEAAKAFESVDPASPALADAWRRLVTDR